MSKIKVTDEEQVNAHIQKIHPNIKEAVEALRLIILATDRTIAEQIKWNNPSFYYNGPMTEFEPKEYKRDIAVMNLHKNRIMLVLPSGAKVNDTYKLLEGTYADGRRLITFKDLNDVKAKAIALQDVIRHWLALVEK